MTLGRNTAVGRELMTIVERVEACQAAAASIRDDISAILAEAKFKGFIPKAIRHVVKVRSMKPHDRQESEAIIATYLHALGEDIDTPLFRQVNAMAVDVTSREAVTEALKQLCPTNGTIIVEVGGKGVRLTRDASGEVTARDLNEPAWPGPTHGSGGASSGGSRGADTGRRPTPAEPVDPEITAEEAEALGRAAFRLNAPIVRNPFPFGDDRRASWDRGWRLESGSDGMGPGGQA